MITVGTAAQLAALIRAKNWEFLGHARKEEVEIMVGIVATESGFTHRVQIGGGPACGLFQIEPDTAFDVYLNYLRRKPDRLNRLMMLSFDMPVFFFPARICLPDLLKVWDDFSFLIARCVLLRRPEPIPKDVEAQARYYKRWYNTPDGAGSVEKYLKDWEAHGCQSLIDALFARERDKAH